MPFRWAAWLIWVFGGGALLVLKFPPLYIGVPLVIIWVIGIFEVYVKWGPYPVGRAMTIRELREKRELSELNEEWIRDNEDFLRKMDKVERIRQRKLEEARWSGHDGPSVNEFYEESVDEVFGDDDDYYDPYDD
ncbi:MAG: hypothetical protein K2M45_03135 [Muribaculaceae bacterium]|nr:hypothetical protein [Muribaculaceae bacterium]